MIEPTQHDRFFRIRRRAALSRHPTQIGIDYVEVVNKEEDEQAALRLWLGSQQFPGWTHRETCFPDSVYWNSSLWF